MHIFVACFALQTGTNAGEAFGQLGIGVYGKKWLSRGNNLRVEFKYRHRRFEKKVQSIRLPITSPTKVDETIRQWLRSKRKRDNNDKKLQPASPVQSLFGKVIAQEIVQSTHQDFQNAKKRMNFGTSSPATASVTTSSCIAKLQRARYARLKRQQRERDKELKIAQVNNNNINA